MLISFLPMKEPLRNDPLAKVTYKYQVLGTKSLPMTRPLDLLCHTTYTTSLHRAKDQPVFPFRFIQIDVLLSAETLFSHEYLTCCPFLSPQRP